MYVTRGTDRLLQRINNGNVAKLHIETQDFDDHVRIFLICRWDKKYFVADCCSFTTKRKSMINTYIDDIGLDLIVSFLTSCFTDKRLRPVGCLLYHPRDNFEFYEDCFSKLTAGYHRTDLFKHESSTV